VLGRRRGRLKRVYGFKLLALCFMTWNMHKFERESFWDCLFCMLLQEHCCGEHGSAQRLRLDILVSQCPHQDEASYVVALPGHSWLDRAVSLLLLTT
jgi:hypothetical protein